MNTRLQTMLSVVVMGLAGCAKSTPSGRQVAQPALANASSGKPAKPGLLAIAEGP